jgi:hypothetical protein
MTLFIQALTWDCGAARGLPSPSLMRVGSGTVTNLAGSRRSTGGGGGGWDTNPFPTFLLDNLLRSNDDVGTTHHCHRPHKSGQGWQ